jgi:hypothetical protein
MILVKFLFSHLYYCYEAFVAALRLGFCPLLSLSKYQHLRNGLFLFDFSFGGKIRGGFAAQL